MECCCCCGGRCCCCYRFSPRSHRIDAIFFSLAFDTTKHNNESENHTTIAIHWLANDFYDYFHPNTHTKFRKLLFDSVALTQCCCAFIFAVWLVIRIKTPLNNTFATAQTQTKNFFFNTKLMLSYSLFLKISRDWCFYFVFIFGICFCTSLVFHRSLEILCCFFFIHFLFSTSCVLWPSAQRTTIVSTSLRILVQKLLLKFFETF